MARQLKALTDIVCVQSAIDESEASYHVLVHRKLSNDERILSSSSEVINESEPIFASAILHICTALTVILAP